MGQKVCPIGFRLGITQNWRSRWYADKKNFGKLLVEDQKIRKYIKKNYRFTGISKIEINFLFLKREIVFKVTLLVHYN